VLDGVNRQAVPLGKVNSFRAQLKKKTMMVRRTAQVSSGYRLRYPGSSRIKL